MTKAGKITLAICAVLACAMVGSIVWAQLPNSNYRAQGGLEWVIGGTLTVEDSATVTIASGATWTNSAGAALENGETITNATDGEIAFTFDDDAAELGQMLITTSNTSATMANDDYFRKSIEAPNDENDTVEYGTFDGVITDVTTTTEDFKWVWGVMTNATLADELELEGAALYPTTDAGLDLGKSGAEFNDGYFDGTVTTDAFEVGTRTFLLATDDISSGGTSVAVTATGVDSDDLVLATLNTSCGTYITHAVPSTDTVTVTVAGATNTAATVTVQAWLD